MPLLQEQSRRAKKGTRPNGGALLKDGQVPKITAAYFSAQPSMHDQTPELDDDDAPAAGTAGKRSNLAGS